MRVPQRDRFSSSLAVTKSFPSKTTDPDVILHPGLVNPILAKPSVDLPAPDSPIKPITSPRWRVRSMPLIILCQRSSEKPSILISFISRRMSPFLPCLVLIV